MTPLDHARRQYATAAINTAPVARLTAMLADRAVLDIDRAAGAEARGDPVAAAAGLAHARSVVLELLASLDRERGGEIAEGLARVYVFAAVRLRPPAGAPTIAAVREALVTVADAYRALGAAS